MQNFDWDISSTRTETVRKTQQIINGSI